MASISIKFTVTPSANVSDYWITAAGNDVQLNGGVGSTTLSSPGSYILVWHFEGPAGETLSIAGTNGNTAVVQVKQSTIPDGESAGAGSKRFTI